VNEVTVNEEVSLGYSPKDIRSQILKMAHHGATAHIACAFSIVEILAVLYRNHLQLEGKAPDDINRNILALSKGHGVMALYVCLVELGWLKQDDLDNYFKNGTKLKGLGDAHVPGVETTSGSLGHGLNVAVGMALGAKRLSGDQKTFCIVGDGEMNEGTCWEAMLFAAHNKLDNLCIIVDENGYQAMGTTDDVLALGDLQQKFEAFGFDCVSVDGHDEDLLDAAFESLMEDKNGKPKAVVAKTVKGKGVSFMEGDNVWHYTRVNAQQFDAALEELKS
jgi:transketolase